MNSRIRAMQSESFKTSASRPPAWPTVQRPDSPAISCGPATDYTGKRVLVIGSGATAATVIPALAEKAAHVTMLQRSPTYFFCGENRNELADRLAGC